MGCIGSNVKPVKYRTASYNKPLVRQRILEAAKLWYAKNKKRVWFRNMLRKYGMTAKDYDLLLTKQNHCCAICKLKSKQRLVIDHSHSTTKVRGLLCQACNLGLGHFKESLNSLRNAQQYVLQE